MSRAVSPLRQAEDAIVLDNSHMTVDEQMDWFMEQLRQLRERMRAQEGRQTEQQQ